MSGQILSPAATMGQPFEAAERLFKPPSLPQATCPHAGHSQAGRWISANWLKGIAAWMVLRRILPSLKNRRDNWRQNENLFTP
jgi:hypothetical protein